MLSDDLFDLPEFAKAVFLGLVHESFTDPELLVLTTSGLLLASRSRPLKGIGIALAGWYVTRKADTYMSVFDSKMRLIAKVINAGNSSEEVNGHQA